MGLTIQGAGYLSSKQTRLAGGAGRCAFQLNRVWGWDAARSAARFGAGLTSATQGPGHYSEARRKGINGVLFISLGWGRRGGLTLTRRP